MNLKREIAFLSGIQLTYSLLGLCLLLIVSPSTAVAGVVPTESIPATGRTYRFFTKYRALEQLVAEALVKSPRLQMLRDEWLALAKVPSQVSTLPDPQIVFQNLAVGSPRPGSGLQSSDFAYFGYGVSQDIPYPGKLRSQAKLAQAEADAARIQLELERRQVAEQVRENYFNLFYLEMSRTLVVQMRDDLRNLVELSRSQYQIGLLRQQDLLKAQLASTQLLTELALINQEWRQTQANLKALLGRDQDSDDIRVGEVHLTPVSLDKKELQSAASNTAPEILQAQTLELKARRSLKLARQQFIPDFTVAYMYQNTGARFPDYYMATIGLKIPLYFWRKQTPAVEQAELEHHAAVARTTASKLSVHSLLENAWTMLTTTEQVARLYDDAILPQAQATLASAIAAYRSGRTDFPTLLNTQIELLNLRRQYYRAVTDHEIALAKIQQLLGSEP